MTNPYPITGDIIVSDFNSPFFDSELRGLLRGNRKDIPAGTPLTVVYSEEPTHGTNSHNLDVYHPDFGKHPIVVDRNNWKIVNRPAKENA